MMQHVYVKCSYEIIGMPNFFEKLKAFVGEFRIEQQPIEDTYPGCITISFYTDKVNIEEGKKRQVDLTAKKNGMVLRSNGDLFEDWDFTEINCF
jgi:hypothetical protein